MKVFYTLYMFVALWFPIKFSISFVINRMYVEMNFSKDFHNAYMFLQHISVNLVPNKLEQILIMVGSSIVLKYHNWYCDIVNKKRLYNDMCHFLQLCPHLDWEWMFYLFGFMGFVWVFLWMVMYKEIRTSTEEDFVDPPKVFN